MGQKHKLGQMHKMGQKHKVGQMHKMSGFLLLIKNSFLARKVLFMGNIAQKISINLGMVWGNVYKKFEQNWWFRASDIRKETTDRLYLLL